MKVTKINYFNIGLQVLYSSALFEGRHTKASEPEFQDKDYDDQVGDYEDEIYSYEEQKTTSQHPKNLQAITEADFYSRDPEYHDADYDDKFW